MPIKWIDESTPRLSVIGTLNKGAPKNDKGYSGKDLNQHFRFASDDPEMLEAFEQTFGVDSNHPFPVAEKVEIGFPLGNPADVFEYWIESWGKNNTLLLRGDGEKLVSRFNGGTKERWDEGDPNAPDHPRHPDGHEKAGQTVGDSKGYLKVTVPALGTNGAVTLTVGSSLEIRMIKSEIEAEYQRKGTLIHSRATLYRKPVKRPRAGQAPVTKWLVHISFEHSQPNPTSIAEQHDAMIDTETGEIESDFGDIAHWKADAVSALAEMKPISYQSVFDILDQRDDFVFYNDWNGFISDLKSKKPKLDATKPITQKVAISIVNHYYPTA